MATITTNMSLETPAVGDSSSTYPTSISNSHNLIDVHDHSAGKGVQIVTGGITDLAVTTAKIAALAVTDAKLAADAVTTAKILDANVTKAKLAALGQQVSASSGAISDSAAVYTDATNLTVTITTVGRPVYLSLIDDGSGNPSYIGCSTGGGTDAQTEFAFDRGGTTIASNAVYIVGGNNSQVSAVPVSSMHFIDVPAAGTYTYKVKYRRLIGAGNNLINYAKLIAYEL
jgi:hypothetical protein